jgi:hypothetical protein
MITHDKAATGPTETSTNASLNADFRGSYFSEDASFADSWQLSQASPGAPWLVQESVAWSWSWSFRAGDLDVRSSASGDATASFYSVADLSKLLQFLENNPNQMGTAICSEGSIKSPSAHTAPQQNPSIPAILTTEHEEQPNGALHFAKTTNVMGTSPIEYSVSKVVPGEALPEGADSGETVTAFLANAWIHFLA